MARIRTIKPEFFRHSTLFRAEQESKLPLRIAFAGLWTVADREGRFKWRATELKLDCLPYDNVDFSEVLEWLLEIGLLHRYVADGEVLGCIPSWHQHQVINIRESKSKIQPPESGVVLPSNPSRHLSASVKREVMERDGGECKNCKSKEDLQFDHVLPFSKGGSNEASNIQVLCRDCNLKKSDKIDVLAFNVHAQSEQVHAQGEGKGREGNNPRPPAANAAHKDFLDYFWAKHQAAHGQKPSPPKWVFKNLPKVLNAIGVPEAKRRADNYFADPYLKAHPLEDFIGSPDKWIECRVKVGGTSVTDNRVQMDRKRTAL